MLWNELATKQDKALGLSSIQDAAATGEKSALKFLVELESKESAKSSGITPCSCLGILPPSSPESTDKRKGLSKQFPLMGEGLGRWHLGKVEALKPNWLTTPIS